MSKHKRLLQCVATGLVAVVGTALHTPVAANELPYRGSCDTAVTPLTAPGVFPQQLRIDLDCMLAHLGRTSGVATQIVTPVAQTGVVVTAIIENATAYTAANGDVLEQSFAGAALINLETGNVRFIGTETFNGGTGRFSNASGTSDLEGTASIFTNIGFYTVEGRLAY